MYAKQNGLDQGWKQTARLGRAPRAYETRALGAREILRLFLRYVKPILRMKSIFLQSIIMMMMMIIIIIVIIYPRQHLYHLC